MSRVKTILVLATIIQATASLCQAGQIIHNYRWPSFSGTAFWSAATTDGSTIMTNWEDMDPNDANDPDIKRLTESEPNSAFWVQLGKGIRLTTELRTAGPITNTPSGDWYITAPFSFVGALPDMTQTMEPNLAPVALNDWNQRMDLDNGGSNTTNQYARTFSFNNLKFQGLLGGWRPTEMHIAGKITLTGPTALTASRDGDKNRWYLDAEVDASAIDEIRIEYWTRELNYPPAGGLYIRSEPMWFCGKWVLENRMYADKAGCLGDADIQINGGGTPGLIKASRVQSGVAWPWIDRRSGNLWITAANAVSRNAKMTIDTTMVVASPATYGTATAPYTAANPQCPGGKVYVATAASPVYVRELWVDGSQKANGTYYATDAANQPWFGTVAGTTYAGRIIVTGGATRNVTMAAVLDPGAVADANLTIYPASGTTKAFLEGYVLNIKADDPIMTSGGTSYKFVNWTTSTGSGVANVNAAKTTLTVPSGTNITVTAHYVIAASNPSPADTATGISMTTDLDWTPGLLTGTQDLYFGTNPASLAFIKHFADGSSHGATNAEVTAVVGALADTTTYYWRVDTNGRPGATWQFKTEKRRPSVPNPADGATNVERITPKLSWDTGHASATKWDVYFGTSPSSLAYYMTKFVDGNDPNAPAGLNINTTYYWRVDEYNTYGSPLTGFVWSFTTRGPLCMGIGKGDIDADCKVTFVDFAMVVSSYFNK
jgi:hypothetical protein